MRLVACKVDIWALRNYEWIFLVIWVASCKTNVKFIAPYCSGGESSKLSNLKVPI
jgi:hypothetical protein